MVGNAFKEWLINVQNIRSLAKSKNLLKNEYFRIIIPEKEIQLASCYM